MMTDATPTDGRADSPPPAGEGWEGEIRAAPSNASAPSPHPRPLHRGEGNSAPRVTVWFDGGCPLCLREIALMRRLDRRGAIAFVDLTDGETTCPIDRGELLARFHAREGDGPLVSGAAAFSAMWRAIPALAWAGRAARNPLIERFLERGYRIWLRLRPTLQRALRNRAVSVDASPPARL